MSNEDHLKDSEVVDSSANCATSVKVVAARSICWSMALCTDNWCKRVSRIFLFVSIRVLSWAANSAIVFSVVIKTVGVVTSSLSDVTVASLGGNDVIVGTTSRVCPTSVGGRVES